MGVRFILRFLLILLVSMLFSVSNRFLLLQIIEVYNKEEYIENSLRQWYYSAREIASYSGSWQNILFIIRPIYAKKFVAKEANKLQMQVKIGVRFHRAEITYSEINWLYAYVKQIQQANFIWRNSILIKVQV